MAKRKPRARKTKVYKGKAAERHLKKVEQQAAASPAVEQERAERDAAAKANAARIDALGLRELVIKDCPWRLLVLKDSKAEPTMEQRRIIARRLIDVGPKLPHYVKKGELMKRSIPGVSTAELEKAFKDNAADEAERQKKLAQEAKKKEKEEAAKKKAEAAQRKKAKSADVTPKVKPKPEPVATSKLKQKTEKAAAKPAAKPAPKKGGKTFAIPKVPAGGFNKTNKPATSGELIRARIMEHKLTDAQIATEVRKLFEGRTTSETDVRWNRGQMRLRGIEAPDPVGGEPQKARK